MSHNLFLPEHLMDVRHITKMSAPEQQREFQLVPGSKVRTLKAERTLHLSRVESNTNTFHYC